MFHHHRTGRHQTQLVTRPEVPTGLAVGRAFPSDNGRQEHRSLLVGEGLLRGRGERETSFVSSTASGGMAAWSGEDATVDRRVGVRRAGRMAAVEARQPGARVRCGAVRRENEITKAGRKKRSGRARARNRWRRGRIRVRRHAEHESYATATKDDPFVRLWQSAPPPPSRSLSTMPSASHCHKTSLGVHISAFLYKWSYEAIVDSLWPGLVQVLPPYYSHVQAFSIQRRKCVVLRTRIAPPTFPHPRLQINSM